jgi:hypothetical protein
VDETRDETREVVWSALGRPGLEHVSISVRNGELSAAGRGIAVLDGVPTHVTYALRTDRTGATRWVDITVSGPFPIRTRTLHADGQGHWRDDAGPLPEVDGCLEVDISFTPCTNTLPIRRLALAIGEARDIDVAYLSVPRLTISRARQRYRRLDRGYRYESGRFAADLTVDDAGLVVDYPNLWRRA